jgi:membrane associated rhomboid family serine protease
VIPLKDSIPTERLPWLTIGFIIANVVVYFGLQGGGILSGPDQSIVVDYGAIPYEITHPGDHCDEVGQAIACEGQQGVSGTAEDQPPTWLTLFSAMFMHGSILHLGGNMLFLWIFGNNIEDSMSKLRFVVFYLLGGLAALGLQVLVGPNSAVPTIGASGAIAAVLGGYLIRYPRARIITVIFIVFFFTVLELPALLVLGFWFAQQILFGALDWASPAGGGGGGVAYFAHIGGFVFGMAAIGLFAQRRAVVPPRRSRVI